MYLSEEYQDNRGDGKKLVNLTQNKDIEMIFIKKTLFRSSAETVIKLEKLCGNASQTLSMAEKDRPAAMAAAEGLIQTMKLMSFDDTMGKYHLILGSVGSVMRLDSAAAEAVNLLPRRDHPSAFGSLYGVLNRCKTKMGSRLLERWLRQPLMDHKTISGRQDVVELLKGLTSLRNQLSDEGLKAIPDLDAVVTR
jgi:DNA mismatch repair protein MSH2